MDDSEVKQQRHAVFMYTSTFTFMLLAIYLAMDATRMRDAYTESQIDNRMLADTVVILNKSFEGGKKEIAELNKAAATAGKACRFTHPVRKPAKQLRKKS